MQTKTLTHRTRVKMQAMQTHRTKTQTIVQTKTTTKSEGAERPLFQGVLFCYCLTSFWDIRNIKKRTEGGRPWKDWN